MPMAAGQFSVRDLLIATALCALLVASLSDAGFFFFSERYAPWPQLGLAAVFIAIFAFPFAARSEYPARRWPLLVPALCWFCYAWWALFASRFPPDGMRFDLHYTLPVLFFNSFAAPVVLLVVNSETVKTDGLKRIPVFGMDLTLLVWSAATALVLTTSLAVTQSGWLAVLAFPLYLLTVPLHLGAGDSSWFDLRGDGSVKHTWVWLVVYAYFLGVIFVHLWAYRFTYLLYQKHQGTSMRAVLARWWHGMFPEDEAADNWTRPAHLTGNDARVSKSTCYQAADQSEAFEIGSDAASPYLVSGFAWFEMGEYDKAIKDCTRAIRKNRRHPDKAAHYFRGRAWEAKEKYDKAIKDFTQAIRIDPDFAKAYVRRAGCWERKGEAEKAERDRVRAKELSGDNG